jgi:hypothetical protein
MADTIFIEPVTKKERIDLSNPCSDIITYKNDGIKEFSYMDKTFMRLYSDTSMIDELDYRIQVCNQIIDDLKIESIKDVWRKDIDIFTSMKNIILGSL